MSISTIIQLFQTPSFFIISLTFLVLAIGFALKNLHIKCKDFELNAKSKKKKNKK